MYKRQVPSYVYAKFTGRGMMAEMFGVKKVGADPDALPEGWHDKPKKEEPGWFGGFWRDPYFLLGFSVPVLYAIHLYTSHSVSGPDIVDGIDNQWLLYVVTAVITNPFYGDSSESPFVRAGTGIHMGTVATIALVIGLLILAVLLAILALTLLIVAS